MKKTAASLFRGLIIGLCMIGFSARAQVHVNLPFCFSDELLKNELIKNPELQKQLDAKNTLLRLQGKEKKGMSALSSSSYIIPVVVYIVHNNGPENITDQQVTSQIDALNAAFAPYGIKFCLATLHGGTALPGTPTPGIIRIQNTLTNHTFSDEGALKSLSTLEGDKYLRIWVVKDINSGSGVTGYARFPGSVPTAMDGIVMRYDVFGEVSTCACSTLLPGYNQGKILAHEVGHYLDLYHTFQGGCAGMSSADCSTSGDLVCDTPPVAAANVGCPSGVLNSCNETPDNPDLLNNHMDYTNDNCRNSFTPGQQNRMLGCIALSRSTLVSSPNLAFTGVQCTGGLVAAFTADNSNPCTNIPVVFTALTTNPTGTVYAWDFGDGSTGTGSPAAHAYTAAGIKVVTLTVTNGSSGVSASQSVYVSACSPITSTQGNWYFGEYAGLNFSAGFPVLSTAAWSNLTIINLEGCISQSDASGNLLFYGGADGTGMLSNMRIYNKNHQIMTPGTPLKGSSSTTQQAVSVPAPGNPNRYYVFHNSAFESSPRTGLRYTIVDMSLNATLGDLVPGQINVPVAGPAGAPTASDGAMIINESLTALGNCSGDGYWIIVNGIGTTGNTVYIYSLTSAGLSTPQTFVIPDFSVVSAVKSSPDGTKLAFGGSGAAWVFDFNRQTGVISNEQVFPLSFGYGISFSPNSKLLYASSYEGVYQYDLTSSNPNSTKRALETSHNDYKMLQLGPDNKIYIANPGGTFISVINYPDVVATASAPNACGYNFNGPVVRGTGTLSKCSAGLPNMIDAKPAALIPPSFTYTISSCTNVAFVATPCGATYQWNFGDGGTSSLRNPNHTYAANGTYTVTLTVNGSVVVTQQITIGIAASIAGSSTVCAPGSTLYNYSTNMQPGFTYSWSATGGTISGFTNSNNVDITWNTLPGTVTLTVTNPAIGCTATTSLSVGAPTGVVVGTTSTNICAGESVVMSASGWSSYVWSPGGATTPSITVSPAVTTTYTVTGSNPGGCSASTAIVITVKNCNVCSKCPSTLGVSGTVPSASYTGISFCLNNSITVTGNVILRRCEVKIASGVSITIAPGAILTIEGSHLYACNMMWNGIVVNSGGRLNIINCMGDPSISSSLIEDALVAVNVQSTTVTSSVLYVNNSTFNRNEVGIRIQGYNQSITTYPFSILNSAFTCRDLPFSGFTPFAATWPQTNAVKLNDNPISSPLETPYINNINYPQTGSNAFLKAPAAAGSKSKKGLDLLDVGLTLNAETTSPTYYEISLGEPSVAANNYSVFDNQEMCIAALNTNFTTVNTIFQNTVYHYPKQGEVIPKPNTTGSGIYGIANETGNFRMRAIEGSNQTVIDKFFNCTVGINTTNYYENIVRYADLRSTQQNPAPFLVVSHPGESGILFTTNRFRVISVLKNALYNIQNGILFNANFGAYTIGSGSETAGQYSGQVNVDNNIIRQNLPGIPVTDQYVSNAIVLSTVVSGGAPLLVLPFATINAGNNSINGVYRGILATNWEKKNVITNNNTVTLVADPYTTSPTQFGISHQNNITSKFGNSISYNTVTGPGINKNSNFRAIYTSLCANQVVQCNTVRATTKGIEFAGVQPSTRFVNNTMSNHRFGYVLSNGGVIGQQGTPAVGIGQSKPSDNRWIGSWPPISTFKTATLSGSTAQSSKLYIRNSAQFNPNMSGYTDGSGTYGITDYFNSGTSGTLIYVTNQPLAYGCLEIISTDIKPSLSEIELLEQIVNNTLAGTKGLPGAQYISKDQLFRMLEADAELLDASPELKSFYEKNLFTAYRTFSMIENDLASGEFVRAIARDAVFAPVNSIESQYKDFYNLYLKYQMDTILPSDSTKLAAIAAACPFLDGPVVYRARALYNAIYKKAVYFEDNCSDSETRRTSNPESQANTFDVSLFPNPSNGNIRISVPALESSSLHIKIYDVNGKMVYSADQLLSDGETSLKLNLANGVYGIEVSDEKTDKRAFKKLLIQQ